MKKMVLIIALLLVSCGKDEPTVVSRVSAGDLITITVIPVAFNDYDKTMVLTETFIGTVWGVPSGFVGDPVELISFSNGSRYLRIGEQTRMYVLYK